MNASVPSASPATATATAPVDAGTARSLLLQLAGAAALGLFVLYGVAFADSPLAHNAAHDVRHVTVKPCH